MKFHTTVALILIAIAFISCNDADSPNKSSCQEGEKSCIDNDVVICVNGSWQYSASCFPDTCTNGECRNSESDDQDVSINDGDEDIELDLDKEESEDIHESDDSEYLEYDYQEFLEIEPENYEAVEPQQDCNQQPVYQNISAETALSVELPYSDENLLICQWIERWYQFSIDQSLSLRATIIHDPGLGSIELYLYENDHNGLSDFVATTYGNEAKKILVHNSATAGDYYLRILGRGQQSEFDLMIESKDGVYGLPGDSCQTALSIDINQSTIGNSNEGIDDFHSSCGPTLGPDLVYVLTVNQPFARINISIEAEFDSVIAVRTNCNQGESEIQCIDEHGENSIEVLELTNLEVGTYYLIVDGDRWTDSGEFILRVEN